MRIIATAANGYAETITGNTIQWDIMKLPSRITIVTVLKNKRDKPQN